MTELLINKSDITRWRQLPQKANSTVLSEYIRDAQFIDLQGLLGVELYESLMRDISNHTDLLNGGDYTYNGKTIYNNGLKVVIAHYAYARYIRFGSYVNTAYGTVQKNSQHSEGISTQERQIIYKNNQQIAYNYWDNVRKYLVRTDYDGYNCTSSENVAHFKINAIGK